MTETYRVPHKYLNLNLEFGLQLTFKSLDINPISGKGV